MPPLIVALLLGAGTYAGYRTARRFLVRASADRHDAEVSPGESGAAIGEKDLGTLQYDPVTGVYRPSPRN